MTVVEQNQSGSSEDKPKTSSSPENRFECFEDLPGVGPATSKKLKELGFHTIESLATATARELESAGISEKKALDVIRLARGSIDVAFVRADELLKQRQDIHRLSTGSAAVDNLLGGGLETQTITEFYGQFGSGKSQVCHQLCVNIQRSVEQGGLEAAALYIDTENTFRTERLVQMAKHVDLDPVEVARNVIVADAYTSDHQIFLLQNSDKIIKENNIRLIIIDSLTSHFRSEYVGRETLALRQQRLNKHMHKLVRLARAFNAIAVVTNQVMSKPDVFFGDAVHPIGGHVVAHTSHTRVYLRKSARGPVRIARLVSSPYLPDGEGVFKVTENGIEELEPEESPRGR